ncbi:MAG: hypothetical protein HYU74_13230 [Dechloromonas sp.]|nr:hypothetical protein [Dechloromonas sp.]
MQSAQPNDFVPLKTWYYEYGKAVFRSDKLLHYHTKPIQRELIEAGAMAKVGVHIFLHKTKFWPEYQRIIAANLPECG